MSETLQVFATLLLDRGLEFLFAALVTVLSAAFMYVVRLLRARLSDANWQRLKTITREVVLAYEQAKLSDAISTEGAAVKKAALAALQRRLRESGLNKFAENTELLSNTIEATVFNEFNRQLPKLKEELLALDQG